LVHLQGVRQELVHLGDAGGDAEVDGAVTDLDDESTNDVGVDLKTSVRSFVLKILGDVAKFATGGGMPGVPGWDWSRTWLVTLSFLPWPT